MYTLAEFLMVVFAALAVGSLLFLVAVVLASAKELAVRLGNTSLRVTLIRSLAPLWRPARSRTRPREADSLGPDATQNPAVRIKRKWYSLMLRASDGPTNGQSPLPAGIEQESALRPSDSDSGTAGA